MPHCCWPREKLPPSLCLSALLFLPCLPLCFPVSLSPRVSTFSPHCLLVSLPPCPLSFLLSCLSNFLLPCLLASLLPGLLFSPCVHSSLPSFSPSLTCLPSSFPPCFTACFLPSLHFFLLRPLPPCLPAFLPPYLPSCLPRLPAYSSPAVIAELQKP